MIVLLTGGLGYIGSHTAVALFHAGHDVVIFDNLSNSKVEVLFAIEKIVKSKVTFVKGDILNTELLRKTLRDHDIDSVIHFAGLKSVAESIHVPLEYYENNVVGTISLIKAMKSEGVHQLIFSSSATVYGEPKSLPITEDHPTSALNPYGYSKLHIEQMLSDLVTSMPDIRIVSLRYFNPAGAHESGLIGEDPNGTPTNLMPVIVRVSAGLDAELSVYGGDYSTADGTCERDYIHVDDLAQGHLAAIEYSSDQSGSIEFINLGCGRSCSVLELIQIYEKTTKQSVPTKIVSRRLGDSEVCFADVTKAKTLLNWQAKKSISDMCVSAWKFHQLNSSN